MMLVQGRGACWDRRPRRLWGGAQAVVRVLPQLSAGHLCVT